MSYVINTNESISTMALAVYDERDEVLKEVSETDLIFTVKANQRNIKRLYLIGDLLYTNSVTISVTVSDTTQYTAKVLAGLEFTRYSDFADKTNTITINYNTASHKFLNALAVDILLESKTFSTTDVPLSITIGVNS
ncbi:hypothetical protein FDH01_gp014 [Acinetobacter phage vB_AbaM_ME3]|uniref:Uncharacterized protein n=1 Tax=Acinetobacter phage vB_AbaM_ME3 TaxID=1837876 RepID=A0A172Q008_9CAUD|nr:hypothetical protein FDH01_gp014 [Acinetobacter phage vB_AbaM_ME3]AND75175.1 hypothetical protein ME3_14 [Acinetobacter phage vB_AbaM_ME3]